MRGLTALLCVLFGGGHEYYRAWSSTRLYQRCVKCGHVTQGWDVTPALRFRSTWMR